MDSSELNGNIQKKFIAYRKVYHDPELAMELALEECGVSSEQLGGLVHDKESDRILETTLATIL